MENIKTGVIAAVVALVVVLGVLTVGAGLVGNDQSATSVVGGTRFPNGISADSTSPSAGQVRGTTLTVTGASTLSGAVTASGGLTVSATSTLYNPSFGNSSTTLTSAATTTLSAANVCAATRVKAWAPSVANASLTIDTAANLISAGCLDTAGETVEIFLLNTSSTSSYILTSSTNVTIYQQFISTSTGAVFTVASNTPAKLTCMNRNASSVDCLFERFSITSP